MAQIDAIMEHNRRFVAEKGYEKYITDKYPDKKLAVVTCMDTRLTELLPAALGVRNGDAKIIKNAGGVIINPFGSVIRSLLISIFELGVRDIMIIGHTDCGVQHVDPEEMIGRMLDAGVPQDHIDMMRYCDIDFDDWLSGFDDVESSVRGSVRMVREHPLIPSDISVWGYVMDSVTGELAPVECPSLKK